VVVVDVEVTAALQDGHPKRCPHSHKTNKAT
jgi:hypothetical protein